MRPRFTQTQTLTKPSNHLHPCLASVHFCKANTSWFVHNCQQWIIWIITKLLGIKFWKVAFPSCDTSRPSWPTPSGCALTLTSSDGASHNSTETVLRSMGPQRGQKAPQGSTSLRNEHLIVVILPLLLACSQFTAAARIRVQTCKCESMQARPLSLQENTEGAQGVPGRPAVIPEHRPVAEDSVLVGIFYLVWMKSILFSPHSSISPSSLSSRRLSPRLLSLIFFTEWAGSGMDLRIYCVIYQHVIFLLVETRGARFLRQQRPDAPRRLL